MAECIMVGCDLHDRSMLLKMAVGRQKAVRRSWGNTARSRPKMIEDLRRRVKAVGGKRIVFAYEASGSGFVLYDELTAAGIECHVLAPTRIERSVRHRSRKTDEADADVVLNNVRAYVLAGVELPSVWVPDRQTRDDREVVRARLDAGDKRSGIKTQIRWVLKRNGIEASMAPAAPWTVKYRQWLVGLASKGLPQGAGTALGSLLRQLDWLEQEVATLVAEVCSLSRTPRHHSVVACLCEHKGVGILTAMTFLTELGDLSRFRNRGQVGSFLGLTPSSQESGEQGDRKGHITHQGPGRVREVLCQAVWARLGSEPLEQLAYEKLVARNPNHKKIALVARMRHMAIWMWHAGLAAQDAMRAKESVA